MKKKCMAIFLAICVVCSTFVLAQGNGIFDIIAYDFNVFYNDEKLSFDSPVLLINGQTYVPLRDFAEEADMNVDWNGKTKKIMVNDSSLDVKSIFANIFGFDLPQTAQILNYNYVVEGRDELLLAKIFFEESDLEYIKEGLDLRTRLLPPDEIEESKEDEDAHINKLSTKYDWWDILSTKEIQYAYFAFMDGLEAMTIPVEAFICKDNDSGGYYLYIDA